MWREWVKKVLELPHGSLSSQAIEQVTSSELSRLDQQKNNLSLTALMACQGVQTQVEKYLATMYHQQSPHPMDIGTAMEKSRMQVLLKPGPQQECWYRVDTWKTCGKRGTVTNKQAPTAREKDSKGQGK